MSEKEKYDFRHEIPLQVWLRVRITGEFLGCAWRDVEAALREHLPKSGITVDEVKFGFFKEADWPRVTGHEGEREIAVAYSKDFVREARKTLTQPGVEEKP